MEQNHLNKVRVRAKPRYLPERSEPGKKVFFFTYEITITNLGTLPCQLISRHWIITDAFGEEQEVRGPGVVGEQPKLAVGESFTYSSFCPLSTQSGSMRGSYQMQNAQGEAFDAEIPAFALIKGTLLN
jgi:ApaG protein